jgi:hypothetical protein
MYTVINISAPHPIKYNTRWLNCYHDIACPQVADGGEVLQIWRLGLNILNKQLQTADKGFGRGTTNSSP